MRFRIFTILLLILGLQAQLGFAQDSRPAGYIMAYELKGVDAEKGTVVVRKGSELAPKLLMPLYDDDAVFIRDEASRITLSLAKDGNLVVSGKLMRKNIAGEMALRCGASKKRSARRKRALNVGEPVCPDSPKGGQILRPTIAGQRRLPHCIA